MYFISLGIHCTVADGIKLADKRTESYPFDWLWCPSKTTLAILEILIKKSSYEACQYMTTGYGHYIYENPEHFKRVNYITKDQMNPTTGLGITHDTINDDYRIKLTRRLERLLDRIKSGEKIVFIYADATNKNFNYHLDDINFGVDATEYLNAIYDLLYPLNNKIEILYFSWKEHMQPSYKIKHIEHTQEVVNDKNGNCIRQKIANYINKNYIDMINIINNTVHLDKDKVLLPKIKTMIIIDHFIKNNSTRNIYVQVEPEAIKPVESFIINNYKEYDFILTFNQHILNNCPNSYKYIFGMTFLNLDDIKKIDLTAKKFNLSCVTGDKLMTIGHAFRHQVYYNQGLINNIPTTFYISGFSNNLPIINNNPRILKDSNNKIDIFKDSQFSLAIENSRQINYFTEKLCDCLLTRTIPIYYGCPNVSDYFDTTGWIILDNESLEDFLKKISILTPEYYSQYKGIIDKNFETVKKYIDIQENINKALKTIKYY